MARKNGGLKLLPPFADARKFGVEEFRGKMEALSGVRSYLHEIRQKYVVLSDSDLSSICRCRRCWTRTSKAARTSPASAPRAASLWKNATYFTVNEDRPHHRDALRAAQGEWPVRSLEIYLLSRDLLISLVDECAAQDKYSFRSDVLCAMGDKLDLRAFLWDALPRSCARCRNTMSAACSS